MFSFVIGPILGVSAYYAFDYLATRATCGLFDDRRNLIARARDKLQLRMSSGWSGMRTAMRPSACSFRSVQKAAPLVARQDLCRSPQSDGAALRDAATMGNCNYDGLGYPIDRTARHEPDLGGFLDRAASSCASRNRLAANGARGRNYRGLGPEWNDFAICRIRPARR